MSHLERITHVCLISVSVLACVVLVRDHLSGSNRPSATRRLEGTRIRLPSVDWSRQRQTVVLAISSRCHFCTASAPLYHSITTGERRANSRFVVVSGDAPSELESFLSANQIVVDQVVRESPFQIGASGTPTILVVNSGGKVLASFVGQLSSDQEKRLRDLLSHPAAD